MVVLKAATALSFGVGGRNTGSELKSVKLPRTVCAADKNYAPPVSLLHRSFFPLLPLLQPTEPVLLAFVMKLLPTSPPLP